MLCYCVPLLLCTTSKNNINSIKYTIMVLFIVLEVVRSNHCCPCNVWTLFCSSLSILLGQGRKKKKKKSVIFQRESSVLLVHGEVAIIHFKNSILQLKHYLSVMGPGILSIAKLKLSITLIKSTALNTHKQAHTFHAHTHTKGQQTFPLCGADVFSLIQKDSQSKNH